MAKKRKAAAVSQEQTGEIKLDPKDSRKRIRTYEDVADSDDEFHLNQDEIRLGEAPETKRRRKIREDEEFLEQADEEVLGHSEDEDGAEDDFHEASAGQDEAFSDSDDFGRGHSREGEEEELGWGTTKADLYGADAIETEEQALEEEAEGIRLQKKQLEQMNAADYGFDEDAWQEQTQSNDREDRAVVTEVLPQLQVTPDMGSAERLKLLKSRYPEFEPLSKELLVLKKRRGNLVTEAETSPVARTKLRVASAYLGALTMYFSLFTSTASTSADPTAALASTKLRNHPVMESLIQCRELWAKAASLQDTKSTPVEVAHAEDLVPDTSGDDSNERQALPIHHERKRKSRQSRAERHADAVKLAAEARKAERMKRTEADLADLDTLVAPARSKKLAKTTRVQDEDSDFGEEAPLTAREAAEKAQKKKSLRFYTSQIAQKSNKRGTAGRSAGGDDDIPYRERLRDRQARLNAEAEKRGKHKGDEAGADLGGDSDEEDHRQAQQIRADVEEDDYYDMIATRTSKKKSDKAALAEAQRQAALRGGQVVQEETVGEDGKRKISYAIEKNKGLTPHRKKDVRNPRVKKRKKYDERKKKLASIKPVYEGGEGRGGYGGELTGIKSGLVKSTKLS